MIVVKFRIVETPRLTRSDLLEARTLNTGIFHLPFSGAFIVFKTCSSEVLKSAYFDLNQVEK